MRQGKMNKSVRNCGEHNPTDKLLKLRTRVPRIPGGGVGNTGIFARSLQAGAGRYAARPLERVPAITSTVDSVGALLLPAVSAPR